MKKRNQCENNQNHDIIEQNKFENYKNYENLKNPYEKHKNYENIRNLFEKHANHENLKKIK